MKKGIVTSSGPSLLGVGGEEIKSFPPLPKVAEIKPTGSLVLLEILDQQEVLGTSMILPSSKRAEAAPMYGAPQAWVRAVGPQFKSDSYGYQVGDRVLLSTGVAVPCPQRDGDKRDWVIVEPQAVRGVIVEETHE